MLGGNMNTVPQIEYDDEKDINILKGQLIERRIQQRSATV